MDAETEEATRLVAMHDVHLYSQAWARAMHSQRLGDALEDLLGPEVELHHSTLHVKPPGTGHPFPMHQDVPFYPHADDRYVDTLVHLDDTSDANGCIRFLDGSHRLGPLEHITLDGASEPHLPTDVYRLDDTVPVPARRGDVVAFHPYTIHGSRLQHDRPHAAAGPRRLPPSGQPPGSAGSPRGGRGRCCAAAVRGPRARTPSPRKSDEHRLRTWTRRRDARHPPHPHGRRARGLLPAVPGARPAPARPRVRRGQPDAGARRPRRPGPRRRRRPGGGASPVPPPRPPETPAARRCASRPATPPTCRSTTRASTASSCTPCWSTSATRRRCSPRSRGCSRPAASSAPRPPTGARPSRCRRRRRCARPSPPTSRSAAPSAATRSPPATRREIAARLGLEVLHVGARFENESPPHRFAAYLARSVPEHAAAAHDWPTHPGSLYSIAWVHLVARKRAQPPTVLEDSQVQLLRRERAPRRTQ